MNIDYAFITEEHVTRKLAFTLASYGHEIVAVHPPDGQGPFVIPKSKKEKDIERSSYHPDIVSIDKSNSSGNTMFISECKLREEDLNSDIRKLREFASDIDSILYAFFRCQLFEGGPLIGFDFDAISKTPQRQLPLKFVLAAAGDKDEKILMKSEINGFDCIKYIFAQNSLFF